MKRLLILLLLLAPAQSWAWMGVHVAGSGVVAAGAACDAEFTNTTVGTADLDIHDDATSNDAYKYVGQYITPASNVTICRVDFYISYKAGDISGKTFRAYISTLGAGSALDTMTEADATVAGNNSWEAAANSTGTAVTFEWDAGYAMTASTEYAIVVTMDGAADASNYAELEYSVSSSIPGAGATAARWNSLFAESGAVPSNQVKMVIYAQ